MTMSDIEILRHIRLRMWVLNSKIERGGSATVQARFDELYELAVHIDQRRADSEKLKEAND